LAIQEKALGPGYPGAANSLKNLAALRRVKGEYEKASPLYQRALTIWENVLGLEHPTVATAMGNYAQCLRDMDRPEEADSLETRAKAIRAKNAWIRNPDDEFRRNPAK
jgi:hypothetical protein